MSKGRKTPPRAEPRDVSALQTAWDTFQREALKGVEPGLAHLIAGVGVDLKALLLVDLLRQKGEALQFTCMSCGAVLPVLTVARQRLECEHCSGERQKAVAA